MVRDASRSPWSGSNTTKTDEGSSNFAVQEDEVTVLPGRQSQIIMLFQTEAKYKPSINHKIILSPCYLTAFRVHGSSNETAGPVTTLGPPMKIRTTTQIYKSLVTSAEVSHPVLDMNSSMTLGLEHLTNQVVTEQSSPKILGPLQNATQGTETDTNETSGHLSSMTEGPGMHTGRPVTHTKDHNSSLFSSDHPPFTASFFSDDATEMKATTTHLPNITVQNSSTPLSLLHSPDSLFNLKYGEMKIKDLNSQDSKLHTTLNPQTTTTTIPSAIHSENPPRSTFYNPRDLDQTSSVKFETQSSSSEPWSILTKFQSSITKHDVGKQSLPQTHHLKPFLQSQTSSPRPLFNIQTSPSKPFLQADASHTSLSSQASTPKAISQSQTSLLNAILSSKSPTPQSFPHSHTTTAHSLSLKPTPSHYQFVSYLLKPQPESSQFVPQTGRRQTSSPYPQLQTTASLSSPHQPQPLSTIPKALPLTTPTQTKDQGTIPQKDQSQSDLPPEALSISSQPWSQPHSQTEEPPRHIFGWKQPVTPGFSSPLLFTSRQLEGVRTNEGIEVKVLHPPEKIKTTNPISAFVPLTTPLSYFSRSAQQLTLQSSSSTSTYSLLASSLVHRSSTVRHTSPGSTVRPSLWSMFFTHSISTSMKNQLKTAPALLVLPSPISIPPHFSSAQPSSSSTVTSLLASSNNPFSNSSHYPSPTALFSPVPLSASSSSPFTSFQSITGSTFSLPSSSTMSPLLSSSSIVSRSSISSATSSSLPLPSSSFTSTPTPTSSFFLLPSPSISFHSTTCQPSPAPRRSFNIVSSLSPIPLQKLTVGQRLLIQNQMVSSNAESILNPPTLRTMVNPNPQLHPNLNPDFKQNFGKELKPNINTKTNPSRIPDKEGKYPDIVPRHSAWELGMLLGCSVGLGMVLVVWLRYMYRQACGKQTEMTLNDREREYGRGERGLIHVQECGDLVRVRRIRENSFVLLAEYDILASPGN